MTTKLPKIEIYLYFTIWISSISYAFYKVYSNGESLAIDESRRNDFLNGWKILNKKKDISDEEWELWADFLIKLGPWFILHLCASELIRLCFIEALPICYLLVTMSVMITYFPVVVPAFFIVQLSLFFLAMMTASKTIIWTLAIFLLTFVNNNIKSFEPTNFMDNNQINLMYVCNGWFYIRCLDFVLSEANENAPFSHQFFKYLGYIFYLPCFFLGPFIPYSYFKYQMHVCLPVSFIKQRIKSFISSMSLYIIYYILYELVLHYVYCNAMHYDIKNYLHMGMWTVSGVGICLANFFYLKYVIVYGVSSSIAKAENYKIPPQPKCIYRIHLYSRMWRHFDRGYYLFMFRCIYSPVCGRRGASLKRRMFASFLCFLFVYIWHGGTVTVLYWSIFNYIGLIIEAVCKFIWKTNGFIQSNVVRNLNKPMLRRVEAIAASPLWLLAVISNFMFFGGHEMGLLFIKQLTQGNYLFYITISIIAYCVCQVSIETTNFENKEHLKYKS